MTTTAPHPPGATLHLGGDAWAHPDLQAATRLDIDGLTPYPGNPRRGDQDAITASIRDLGLYRPVIVQETSGHVLAGNHTLRALRDLGATWVPATLVDVDDTRAAAIVARDNRTSDQGVYDDRELLDLLTGLTDQDALLLSGYEDADLDVIRRIVADLDFVEGDHTAPIGDPIGDHADPIDLDGDAEKVTVTLDPGHRAALYALLKDLPYVRNVTNAHVRTPADA